MYPPVETSSNEEQYYIRSAWHLQSDIRSACHLQSDIPSTDVPTRRNIWWPRLVLHQVSLTCTVRCKVSLTFTVRCTPGRSIWWPRLGLHQVSLTCTVRCKVSLTFTVRYKVSWPFMVRHTQHRCTHQKEHLVAKTGITSGQHDMYSQIYALVEASGGQDWDYIRSAWHVQSDVRSVWHLQSDIPSSDVPHSRGIWWPRLVLSCSKV